MSRKAPKSDRHHFAIALPDNLYVERFSYPESTLIESKKWSKANRKWLESPGIRIAACCKMHFGSEPFRWYGPESPQRLLEDMRTLGVHWVSDGQGGWHCNADIAEPVATAVVVEVPYEEHWEPAPIVHSMPAEDEEEEEAPAQKRPKRAKKEPKREAEQADLFGRTG